MRHLLIVILCSFAALVCCTTKKADTESKSGNADLDSLTKQVVTDTVYLVESNDEDFIKFIKIFHTDTIFQKQRVADVIHGYNSDDDTTLYSDEEIIISDEDYTWDNRRIQGFLRGADKKITDTASECRRSIIIKSDSVIEEMFAIPGSGTFIIYTFEKKDGIWFFTELDNNCL